MTAGKLAIAAAVAVYALSAGGQQKSRNEQSGKGICGYDLPWAPGCYERNVQTIPTTKDREVYLGRVADYLQSQIQAEDSTKKSADLEKRLGFEPLGTYQISATRYVAGDGFSFSQVFRVNTRTGYVCQVVGPNYQKGELYGTQIPLCAQ